MAANKDQIIRIQIIESIPSDFYIENLEGITAETLTVRKIGYKIKLQFGNNSKTKTIKTTIEIDAEIKETHQTLFGIKSTCIFSTPDFDSIVNETNEVVAPQDFIRKLFNISVGGARGMLAVHLADTKLKHITLPLLNMDELKKES